MFHRRFSGPELLSFGSLRLDATLGHLMMDTESNIRIKLLGQPGCHYPYRREQRNFAGDCGYQLQRHFTGCMLSGREFESSGEDYLRTIEVMEAAYISAMNSQVVQMKPST